MMPLAVIYGCSGTVLNEDERAFFAEAQPLGFILFQRNCDNPEQIRELVSSLRECVGRDDAPVLIDQEGGRIQRLKSPHWRDAPAASRFVSLYETNRGLAVEAARLNARLIAHELADLGITVDCAPVLDVPQPGADPIIGDRAYGSDPETISALAAAVCEGFLEGGVLPVIKHIPGHGRADVDSHKALPCVDADMETLSRVDFVPFCALKSMPWAMTAHVLYKTLDADQPATMSADVIRTIRNDIGFDGVLVSDDLSMQALGGSFKFRTSGALASGCDLALHCSGDMMEMRQVAAGCFPLTGQAASRIEKGEAMRRQKMLPLNMEYADAVVEFEAMLA